MAHVLKINVLKDKVNGGIMTCRQVTAREKLLRWLLGNTVKLTVIVPGDTVDEVGIYERKEA